MNVVEASKLLKLDKSRSKIDRISETKSSFVFSIVPKSYNGDPFDRPVTAATSVDKNTGKVDVFNPISVSEDELKSMVTIYKVTY